MIRSGIYKLTSPTGKVYIGQSWDLAARKSHYRRLQCKKQPKLFNSLKKHGFDNHKFEILCELPKDVGQEVLDRFKQTYMNAYRAARFTLLNLKEAGNNGKHSEESKVKMSAAIKSEKQREISRINIKKANQKPRTEKQLEVWRKWGSNPLTEKQKKAGLENMEKGRIRERTEEERELSRKNMLKLNARVRTQEELERMRARGKYAGSLPRTEKQLAAAKQTFLRMHEKRRNLKINTNG